MIGTTTGGDAASRTDERLARLRHIGVSVLPLALFLAGTLAYEQIAAATRAQVGRPSPVAAPAPPTAPAREAATTAAAVSQTVRPGPTTVAALTDRRSLLGDVNAATTTGQSAAALPYVSVSSQTRLPPGDGADRSSPVSLQLGDDAPVGLKLDVAGRLQPGSYAIVRGVPQNAALSHGIGAGAGSWLVDGADLPDLALAMRAGTPGLLVLDVAVLTRDSRLISQQRIEISVHARRPAAEPVHIVPPSPVFLPARAPEIAVEPVSQLARAQTGVTPTGSAVTAAQPRAVETTAIRLGVARVETRPSDRERLRIAIETSGAIPDGAYVVLRGLPQQAALTRGLPIGQDVWLLSLLEIDRLDMVLGGKQLTEPLVLGALLVSSDGQLLAEASVRHDGVPVIVSAAALPERTVSAAPRQQPVNPTPVGRNVVAPAAPKDSARPGVPVSAPIAERAPQLPGIDLSARDVALSRGRRLLQLGNIAVARPLLERAAGEGSSEAAALLGASYDGQWLKRQGVLGLSGDEPTAQRWYEEARRLGAQDIERLVAGVAPGRR